MSWEVLKDSTRKGPHIESQKKGEKPIKKMQKPKDEEKLKISIEEFSWETVDDGSTLDTQETEQPHLVYITNLEGGL